MFDHLTIKKKNFGTLYSCHILQTYSSKNICIEQLNFKGTFLKASLVLSFFNLFFNFYWSTVDLQCSVSFGCIAKWNRYLYTYPVFLRSFSHIGHRIMEDSAVGPCWLSILCRALCICQSLSPNLSLPTFLSPDNCAFYICNCFVDKFIWPFFRDSTCIIRHLPSSAWPPSVRDSQPIHTAAMAWFHPF